MSKWYAVMAALGGLYTVGSLGIPLVLAGGGFGRVHEIGADWKEDTFALVMLIGALVAALVLWIPAYNRHSKCSDIREAKAQNRLVSISDRLAYERLACEPPL